ncbi:hypothetical protein PVT68_12070 [Microbulbifer bruguierae]|uniref:Uncharacterized protein n=1 Tax=Microbulbifer bruguierae TaxID=3029061 RepID=A0ABY8NA47_9GAMM|nr:hypothetical protein [Microbulbifer bruguierae]WGL15505.1 hypothetical protein PVT68_12070 [Microbulbifer bruguierae]
MSHVYVLTNQHLQFLSKSNEWIDGREVAKLFRSEFKDVAINQMFEANTRDVTQRIELLECELDAKKQPLVPADALSPEPLERETPPEESPATESDESTVVEAAADTDGGDPEELPQPAPSETPPEYNPEIDPTPAPEVEPDQYPGTSPEIEPQVEPEILPDQPPEATISQA